jgi:hypothetical protein
MEPVFMMTSQSAGTAAAFALDDGVPVQQVSYPKLAAQLLADGQILSWNSVASVGTNGIIMTVSTTPGVTVGGAWTAGSNAGGWPLPNGTYWHDGDTGTGKYVRFNPTLTTNGYYDVYIWWVYASNLGTSGSVTITNGGANGYVIANAVRFMPLGNIAPNPTAALPVVQIVASDAVAGEFGVNPARFNVVCPNGPNAAPLTVNYAVGGTATPGVDYAALPGSVKIPAGVSATNILISPLGNNLTTNQVSVTINLSASANYGLTNLASATAVIQDRPINDWLRANFTPAQLTNAAVSGDTAAPAKDGLPNLMKYALGLNPTTADPNPFVPAAGAGIFSVTFPQSTSATDVALAYDWSTNLVNWISGTNVFSVVNVTDQVTNQIITIGANAAAPAGYLRFHATRK